MVSGGIKRDQGSQCDGQRHVACEHHTRQLQGSCCVPHPTRLLPPHAPAAAESARWASHCQTAFPGIVAALPDAVSPSLAHPSLLATARTLLS
jgi:hypothetical protein